VEYFWPAQFVVAMFVAGLNSKALGVTIAYSVGLLTIYPDLSKAALITIMYIPAVLLATFRE